MKKILLTLIAIASFSSSEILAQDTQQFYKDANTFFSTYVSKGRVDYASIKSNPATLNNLVDQIASISVSSSNAKDYQAFLINAYNISVIKGIVAKYPTKSPLNIKGFFDKTKHMIGGKQVTLNDLENKWLRAKFSKEARFHFVLVCAGLGCPPIISQAYTPAKLEQQLEKQTRLALNRSSFIRVKGNKVQISKIFEWYKEDFVHDGTEVDFINKYRKEPLPKKAKVSYYEYNWSLNSKK